MNARRLVTITLGTAALTWLVSITTHAEPISRAHLAHEADFGMMYWLDGVRGSEWMLQTSRYAMKYDHRAWGPVGLLARSKTVLAAQAHTAADPAVIPMRTTLLVHHLGQSLRAHPSDGDPRSGAIVESGRFFQRRWQTAAVPGIEVDSSRTGLEVSAWPDRLTLQFRLCPRAAMTQARLQIALDLGDAWRVQRRGEWITLTAPDGSGFSCQSLDPTAELLIGPDSKSLVVRGAPADWSAASHPVLGLVLQPLLPKAELPAADQPPLAVSAMATQPASGPLAVRYESAQDWHRISIPKGSPGDRSAVRVNLNLRNPGNCPRTLRLMFDGVPFYVPGLSAVLRDSGGSPIGLPVQLSKNWHGQAEPADHPAGFSGEWFHGISMLSLPANSALELELVMVGACWGTLPAASHSQLCLIGYGGNQQWDEAAIGNDGESLCYDMDHVLTDQAMTDSRPFGMINPVGKRTWNINVGGGSILRVANPDGAALPNRRMRVIYPRYGPNLTEAVFSGVSADGAMEFRYTAGLMRSDDYTRGLHRISIRVLREVPFSRMVFYQQAGDSYHYNQGNTLSWGNASTLQPIRSWSASGQLGQITGEPFALKGPSPWVAITGGTAESGYHPANHGFVIRNWKARLNGKAVATPFAQERRTQANVSIMEIVPPPGTRRLRAGDFVEMELVRIYLPQQAGHYVGGNQPFLQALREHPNDPRLVLREAAGNQLKLTAKLGRVMQTYPAVIQADQNQACFQLRGGVGAVPVTITGLSDYRQPILEHQTPDGWRAVNQAVLGSDFWQCDRNAELGCWEITFTLQPDAGPRTIEQLIKAPQVTNYRFRFADAAAPDPR